MQENKSLLEHKEYLENFLALPKKYLFTALAVFLIFFFAILANEIFLPHTSYKGNKIITIISGMGSRLIADDLKKNGIIRSKWAFELYVSFTGKASELKPGVYTFGQESIRQIANDLLSPEIERTVILREGWSREKFSEELEKNGVISSKDFLAETSDPQENIFVKEFDFLNDKPSSSTLEGYLFPDTYKFYSSDSGNRVVLKILQNFNDKLRPDLREEIKKQHKSIYQILTMASLIEKEVSSDSDRAIVSGILWKRIKEGIPLQVDASIIYLKMLDDPFSTNLPITATDKKIDSPYNTYLYQGLGAGPICNPSLSAIKAAIYPQSSPYFYYISAPSGKTIFSKNLEDQNNAVRTYFK